MTLVELSHPLRLPQPEGAVAFAETGIRSVLPNGGSVEGHVSGVTDRSWPRVASATRGLPAGDPLLRSACQLRCLATPVVLRDAWMARHALGVLNQQRRDSVHEVFRNVVKHPGP